jgi:hypothetical protein
VVLVLILLSVVVAVCVVKKRRKYKLGKPPLYDLPPDAYCTFGECSLIAWDLFSSSVKTYDCACVCT